MYENVTPRKRALHTSPEITWSRCDGCNCLDVTDKTGSKLYQRTGKNGYRYYCDAIKRELTRKEIYDMTEGACPIDRPLPKRRFK